MAKKKYYAVKKGKCPGIYLSWDDCKAQIDHVSGAIYKGFASIEEAKEYLGESQKEESETPEERNGAVAYVDGSFNVNTGEYGSGVVFFYQGKKTEFATKGNDEELALMRNVAGEILASQEAMAYAKKIGVNELTIYHDYQGIASWCLGEWKTNKEGTKAYKHYYDSLCHDLNIKFVKVKGHSNDTWNDRADELAKSKIFD